MAQTISLCIITKDEEKNIANCLNSAKDIADEFIIVDTGSADKTKDVCKNFFISKKILDYKILDFKWADDFSAARNESIKHAAKEWILVLDADETLDEESKKLIKDILGNKENRENDAYLFLQKNYTNESSIMGFVNEEHKKGNKTYAGWYGSFIVRLFRNNKGYSFEGAVHELVEHSIEEKKGKIAATNIAIRHYGNAEPETARKKRQFYLEICKKKVNQKQDDLSYYELGVLYKENNELGEAIKSFKKAIGFNPKHSMALYELGVIYEQQKNYDEAVKNYTESLRIRESSEAFHSLGVCYFRKGMMEDAYRNLVKAVLLNPNKHTIYNTLGAVLEKIGNYDSAAQMLEIAIKLYPKNTVGFYNLGIVLDKKMDFENAMKSYEKALELGHKSKEEIKKRLRQLRIIIANSPNYKYSFKVGG